MPEVECSVDGCDVKAPDDHAALMREGWAIGYPPGGQPKKHYCPEHNGTPEERRARRELRVRA